MEKIWESKTCSPEDLESLKSLSPEEIFLELKRLDGFDSVGRTLTFESFHQQYIQTKNELSFGNIITHEIKSVFEVGCGCGANLYLFSSDGVRVGGIDYSEALIRTARKILSDSSELICGEAVNFPDDVKYDSVFANSVFSYFTNYDYALKVLELMFTKSIYSIGIIDVHDSAKREAFMNYRKQTVSDYEIKYRGLDKFFYDKKFFTDFADSHGLNIRFSCSNMPGYWNNDFVYNVFMTRG